MEFIGNEIPRYAILSHTWGADNEEVIFKDLMERTGKINKAGYKKIQFCGQQAAIDALQYFWVDTCCIDKSSSAEVSEAINSMFRWYSDAVKCYVYLSDVSDVSTNGSVRGSIRDDQFSQWTWEPAFQKSRWFTRGWTLQELVAPRSVEFFSVEGTRLGDKRSLERQIHAITGIAPQALSGAHLSQFSVDERLSWVAKRQTKRGEDIAYSLLGIFDIHMPLLYGEGRKKALVRLYKEIKESSKRSPSLPPALFLKYEGAIEGPVQPPQVPTFDAVNQSSSSTVLGPNRKHLQNVDYVYDTLYCYSYTTGFHRLLDFIVRRFHSDNRIRIAKALATIGPSLITLLQHLSDRDLTFMEVLVQRKLHEYVKFIKAYGTPTLTTRRDGAVLTASKEFMILTGWTREVLLGREENRNVNTEGRLRATTALGGSQLTRGDSPRVGSAITRVEVAAGRKRAFDTGTATAEAAVVSSSAKPGNAAMTGGASREATEEFQPVLFAELMDQDSVVEFYGDYAKLAFNGARGHACRRGRLIKYRAEADVLRAEREEKMSRSTMSFVGDGKTGNDMKINRLGEKDDVIDCMYIWEVRRDVFEAPMMVVMNVSSDFDVGLVGCHLDGLN